MNLRKLCTLCSMCAISIVGNSTALADSSSSDRATTNAIVSACLDMAVMSMHLIDNGAHADAISSNIKNIAEQLSDPIPPAYNGIVDGLNSTTELRGTANVPSAARASTELRAAVKGLWCVIDAAAAEGGVTYLVQDRELQKLLVNYYQEELINYHK